MAKSKRNISEVNGLFIYHEKNIGTVWYDVFTKKGYIMVNSDIKQYMLFTAIMPTAVLVGLMMYFVFKLPIALDIAAFLVVAIAGEVYFRFSFFYKLPVAKNWNKPAKQNTPTKFAEKYSTTRLNLLMILLYAIFIVCIADIYFEKLTAPNMYVNIAMGAAALIFAIIVTIARIKKNK